MSDIFPSDPEGDAYADAWVRTLTHPNINAAERVFAYNAHACSTNRQVGSPYQHHTATCQLQGPCERHRPFECDPAACDGYVMEDDRELAVV